MKADLRPDWLEPGQHLAECVQCSYSLRGLSESGRCPECGTWFDKRWGLWRDGKRLVMSRSAVPPMRCVRCHAAVDELTLFRVAWRHWAISLAVLTICLIGLFGLLLYLILSAVLGKKAVIRIGLCPRHKRQRVWAAFGLGIMLAAAVGFAALAISGWSVWCGPASPLCIFAAIAIWLIWGRPVGVSRIDKHFIWLRRIHPALLDELPDMSALGVAMPVEAPPTVPVPGTAHYQPPGTSW